MRRAALFPLLASLALTVALSARAQQKPDHPLESDPRLDHRLTLSATKPVPVTTILSLLATEANLDLLAVGEDLKETLVLESENPTARELLRKLETALEGRWRREGGIYVLGPPRGYEEIARIPLTRRSAYAAQHWRKLLQGLRRTDWERLRSRKPLEFTELRPPLRDPVRQLARLCYWESRQPNHLRRLKLEWVEREQIRVSLMADPERTGKEVLTVGVCPEPSKDAFWAERLSLP